MLKDTKTIVCKLEFLLGICLQLLFVFFYLAIFNVRAPPRSHAPPAHSSEMPASTPPACAKSIPRTLASARR